MANAPDVPPTLEYERPPRDPPASPWWGVLAAFAFLAAAAILILSAW